MTRRLSLFLVCFLLITLCSGCLGVLMAIPTMYAGAALSQPMSQIWGVQTSPRYSNSTTTEYPSAPPPSSLVASERSSSWSTGKNKKYRNRPNCYYAGTCRPE